MAEYKENMKGASVGTRAMGVLIANEENKELLLRLGHLELFKNDAPIKQIPVKQTSVNVKRKGSRGKSK